MLYDGAFGKTMVSEAFNDMCTAAHVEAVVKASPNPGDPYHAMRLVTFRSFSSEVVKVTQFNRRTQEHLIPAKGTLDIMLAPNEPLPIVERNE
jgi:hypothetical protein